MKSGTCLRVAFSVSLIFFTQAVCASEVEIHNTTDVVLAVAPYYKYAFQGAVRRSGEVITIQPKKSKKIRRPSYVFSADRELAFVEDATHLKEILPKDQFNTLSRHNIGTLQGNHLYLTKESGKLKGYTQTGWKARAAAKKGVEIGKKGLEVIRTLRSGAVAAEVPAKVLAPLIKNNPALTQNPYKDTVAKIRVGNNLPPEEVQAVQARSRLVKQAIEKKFNVSVSRVPKISFIASGGGYRAMTMVLGFLSGADEDGLLDMATWISSLSGSTWAVAGWLSHAQHQKASGGKRLTVSEYRKSLFNRIANTTLISPLSEAEVASMGNAVLLEVAAGQPFTLVNWYGLLLANRIFSDFKDKRHRVYLSGQRELMDGSWIIPIYTAIQAESQVAKIKTDWYEFTPWEVGGSWLGAYVPTWAYGRKFDAGVSTDFALEKTVGFNMGTYGSAFAITIEDMYKKLESKFTSLAVRKLIESTVVRPAGSKRLSWAEVFNFTKALPQSPLKENDTLRLADAGLAFNLPYPPVSQERSERAPDILIFLDASADTKDRGKVLKTVEKYARSKGHLFPVIQYEDLGERSVSIFKDEAHAATPIVIYVRRTNEERLWENLKKPEFFAYAAIKNFDIEKCIQKEFCSTFNFSYTYEQLMKLSMLAEFNMRMAMPAIFDAIRQWIEVHP